MMPSDVRTFSFRLGAARQRLQRALRRSAGDEVAALERRISDLERSLDATLHAVTEVSGRLELLRRHCNIVSDVTPSDA